ncbi:UNVERIFIED_CONTAM: hypothetical protein Sradi_2655200 [Sesamum radiatum]|uniref:CCHC-type domain-containing protein n=1 Tax=Sesamum radiatum TaxID=300843 RepID=A0AAW2S5K8_SESRA
MTSEVCSFIGNKLGQLKEVDLDSNGEVWGSSIRIRVAIDTSKPLKRVLKLRTVLGDEHLVTFTYERLPNFCYLCGRLGHLSRVCDLQLQDGFSDPGQHTPFGPWVRAALSTGFRSRNSGTFAKEQGPSPKLPIYRPVSSLQSDPIPQQCRKAAAIFGEFGSPQHPQPPIVQVSSLVTESPLSNFSPHPLPRAPLTDLNMSPAVPDLYQEPDPLTPLVKATEPLIPSLLPNKQDVPVLQPTATTPPVSGQFTFAAQSHSSQPFPRKQTKLKKHIPKSTQILPQKRSLVDKSDSDSSIAQGPRKVGRKTHPLEDVTNTTGETAGQSRRAP